MLICSFMFQTEYSFPLKKVKCWRLFIRKWDLSQLFNFLLLLFILNSLFSNNLNSTKYELLFSFLWVSSYNVWDSENACMYVHHVLLSKLIIFFMYIFFILWTIPFSGFQQRGQKDIFDQKHRPGQVWSVKSAQS